MNILITGSNRGIGLALCRYYSERGHHVIALCRKASSDLQSLPLAIEEQIDVNDDEALAKIADRYRDHCFDLVINNAAINERMTLETLDFEAIKRQLETNALAPLRVTKHFLPHLKEGAKVVMISSLAGSKTLLDGGSRYGYRMSKAALNMAGAILAIDLMANKIAVGIFDPGYVNTEMIQGDGRLTPDEAAALLAKQIDNLTLATSGHFLDHEGKKLPW